MLTKKCLRDVAGVFLLLACASASAIEFETPVPVAVDGGDYSTKPRVSVDGTMLAFTRSNNTIYTATWSETAQWYEHITQVELPGSNWDNEACFSPDNQFLFYSHRSTDNHATIYRSKWGLLNPETGVYGWDEGMVIPAVDALKGSGGPAFACQASYFAGTTLYFSVQTHSGIMEIWCAEAQDSELLHFDTPERLHAINDVVEGAPDLFDDWMPCVTPDGQTMFWASTRSGGYGGYDIWIATRDTTTGEWTNIRNAGPVINNGGQQLWPSFNAARNSLFFTTGGDPGVLFEARIKVDCPLAGDFESPMGKKKKIGSTLPVKFQLFLGCTPIQSQVELDLALLACGHDPACPEIVLYDVTDLAQDLIDLPKDGSNVGEGGELGKCFRFSDDGKCIYNLWLDAAKFFPDRTYLVDVLIGAIELSPGNELFQTK